MVNTMVKMRSGKDCGVACLAMFLNSTYEEIEYRIKTTLKRDVPVRDMNNVELAVIMKEMMRSPVQVYTMLPNVPAIITVPSIMTPKEFHYVYWDGYEIFDPSNADCYTTEDFKEKLPMADSVLCSYTLGRYNLHSHLISKFDWSKIKF